VHIVATYEDGNIAALMCPYGKGRVAVCGPHPEARSTWLEEVSGNRTWISSVDIAVDFLQILLSNAPLGG
jgi:glutamine amidotransferase-like uncharacterized protein